MIIDRIRGIATAFAVSVLVNGAAASPAHAQGGMGGMAGMSMPSHITIPNGSIITVADVEFMQGMIAHHSQAIFMTHMAAAHGANPRLLKLAEKIDQSQVAEIRIMQNWLRRYNQFTPDTSSWHTMHMAGMLTDDQVKTLDASQGVAFDRNFLIMMMQHHNGALTMVTDLFNSPLAGQEVDISVFANDVVTVQTAEIGVMQRMLSQLPQN